MASRIMGGTLSRAATVVSSGALSTHPAGQMLDGRTSTQAGFAIGAAREVVLDLLNEKSINAFAIAKHNLDSVAATIAVYSGTSSTGPWTLQGSIVFTSAISTSAHHCDFVSTVSTRYIKVAISGHVGTAYISDFTVGEWINTTTGQPVGFITPYWAQTGRVTSNVTRGNELAGLTIESGPREFKIYIQRVEYFGGLEPIAQSIYNAITTGPFYFLWATAEDGFPDAALSFCWLKSSVPQIKWDGFTTTGLTIDCQGFA